MESRERRCEDCGHLNLPTAEFCADCGSLLRTVASSRLQRTQQTQFAVPDYLLVAREREREERRRRLSTETGDGVGLLWIGAIAAVMAIWFGGGTGFGAPLFLLSLLSLVAGLWRLRRDSRNMARAGTATVVVSSVVLGAALAQTLGFSQGAIIERPVMPGQEPEIAAPGAPAQTELLAAEVPMLRGNAARTGELNGEAPRARPLVRWKSFVGGESYASPVASGNMIYLATKSGSIVALSAANGSEVWRREIGDYVARSTPAIDNSTIYITAGYSILALDRDTGEERWSRPLRFAGSCSPAVDGDFVYVSTQEGHLSAFATETGEEVWHYRNDNLLFGSPAVADGLVVIGDEMGQVTAINAESGREVWQERVDGEIFATPAINQGIVYVASTAPELTAFRLDSGDIAWQRPVGGSSSPAITGSQVLLGGDDQAIRALDVKTGETEWSVPLGYGIESSASVSGAIVLIASGPTINAIDRIDGNSLWTHVTGGTVSADVVVAGELIVATSHDGYVYALGAATNAQSLSNTNGGVLLPASR
jgi:outer membrane protein assembly factor BamB